MSPVRIMDMHYTHTNHIIIPVSPYVFNEHQPATSTEEASVCKSQPILPAVDIGEANIQSIETDDLCM